MKADNTNKGWYYKDFKVDMEPVVKKELLKIDS